MSTAIPTTLSNEQRSNAFEKALAVEDGLKELESLKARLLAGLEAQAEAMREQHARLMRAATTGANPEAPEQHPLPLEGVAPGLSPRVINRVFEEEDDETEEGELPPEPQKGKGRNRSRKAPADKTGKKRTEVTASTRTATAARASVGPALELDDAVPAPRIPCCECGHSVADHKDGTGRCSGKAKCKPCRCKTFTAVAVELPGAPGWKVRPFKGQLSTGAGGERACTLLGQETETTPLWWVPKYGLAFQDGDAVSCVYSYLGEKATTLTYEKDPRWNWVPREVLRAVAEHLGATWPQSIEAPDASGLHPQLDDPFTTPATDGKAAPEFQHLDLTTLHAVFGKPSARYHRKHTVTVDGSSPRACEACGTKKQPRAFISFDYEDRESKRGAITGGGGFAMALCLAHCTVDGVERAWSNRAHQVQQERLAREQTSDSTEWLPRMDAAGDHPCECDGCGETFKASELQPVGEADAQGYYCETCKAELEEQDGEGREAPATITPPKDVFGRDWPAIDEVRLPGWFVLVCPGLMGNPDSISAGRLHELCFDMDVKGPEGLELRHLRWFPEAGDAGGCVMVGPHTQPEGASLSALPGGLYAALVDYLSKHWPLPEETKEAARKAKEATAPAPKKPRARKAPAAVRAEPVPLPDEDAPEQAVHKLLMRRGATWVFLMGEVHAQEVDVLVHRERAGRPAVTFAPARWSLDKEGWTITPKGMPAEVVKQLVKALRAESSPAREAVQRMTAATEAPAVATPEAWRVELPERYEGNSIIRLWLVNDATGERKPATWWSGVSALRCSHHLAGKLEGAALQAHLELESWWKEHTDVVAPLAQACRDGKVPGLKVYEPESLGAGPHKYALSGGWVLETWEAEGSEGADDEEGAVAHFTRPTERNDVWERFGPFEFGRGLPGVLTTTNAEAAEWSAENDVVVREAESFIARGFIFEVRPAEVAP